MIRMKISKFKQVCMLAFIPRVFRGDACCSPGKFKKLSLGDQKRAYRCSTNYCTRADNECERCQQIIDRVFSPNLLFTETIFTECDPRANALAQMVFQPPDKKNNCEICRRLIKHIFGEEGEIVEKHTANIEKLRDDKPQVETLNATTAKIHEEQLAQKIEVIDETPLVEAQKPKVEGFNLQPKVLGGKGNERDIVTLNFSTNKNVSDRAGSAKNGATDFDELAKRCLNSPRGQYDECLLKEMEKLGVPPTSGRDFKKKLNEKEFAQAEIMKKHRKPSEKVDLDFMSVDNQDSHFQKVSSPPGITYGKSIRNSMIACRGKPPKNFMKKQHLKQTYDKRMSNASYRHVTSNDIGYLAATGIFGDEPIKSNSGASKQQNEKPYSKGINFVDHISVTIEQSIPQVDRQNVANVKHEAPSTKETTPDLKIFNNSGDQDIIRNLLRTRFEHLMPDSIKSVNYLMSDNADLFTKTNMLVSDQNENSAKPGTKIEDPMTIQKEALDTKSENKATGLFKDDKVYTDSNTNIESTDYGSSEGKYDSNKDPDQLQDISHKYFKSERVTPTHVLYQTDINASERTTLPHPGVIIRDYIEFAVDPTPTEGSKTPPKPQVTKSSDDFLYEVHSEGDKAPKKSDQYQMKGEPTVYKSEIYQKYLDYIQNTQKTTSKSDIYSPHHSIVSTDDLKPVKSICTESKSDAEYISCIIKNKKEPVLAENEKNLSKEKDSTEQVPENAQQFEAKEHPYANQSGNYYPQTSHHQQMQGQNMYNTQNNQQQMPHGQPMYNPQTGYQYMPPAQGNQMPYGQNMYNTQSGQQMPQSQPMYNQQSNPQTPQGHIPQNYVYNHYTNYMHGVQTPQMSDQYFMNQKNIYNPYNYVPKAAENQSYQGATSMTNQRRPADFMETQNQSHQSAPSMENQKQTADFMVSVKQEAVEEIKPIESEKPSHKVSDRVIVAETGRFPASAPDVAKTSATEAKDNANELKKDDRVLSQTLDKPLLSKDPIVKSDTTLNESIIDTKTEKVIISETGQNLTSKQSEEKSASVLTSETKTLPSSKPDQKTPSTSSLNRNEKVNPKDDGRLYSQKINNPLLSKDTFVSVATESIQEQPPSVVISAPCPTESMSLSQLLKKVRERNRLEFCRNMNVRMHCATQVDPAEGKCGDKPKPCPPPAPTCPPPAPQCPPPPPKCPPCPPPPKPKCPPPKPPCPNPCKPKCPSPCTPNPCAPKPPCPPPKKSPCDKFKCNCSPIQIDELFPIPVLVDYGTQCQIGHQGILPELTDELKNENKNEVTSTLQKVCNSFLARIQGEDTVMLYDVEYARTYHPWSPIPSWPIPKKQEKKKLVCPKDGCKEAPPRLNPPCSDINPCLNFPKPNSLSKRSFSILDFIYLAISKATS